MDVKEQIGVALDALCRGEIVVSGVRLNIYPPREILLGFDRSAAPELRLACLDPTFVASFCPAAPGWLFLEKIARGREIEIGGYRIRLHVGSPFPRIVPQPGETRESDSLLLEWGPDFRPVIEVFPLPERLDPQVHSILVMRKGAMIRGGIWHKSMEW